MFKIVDTLNNVKLHLCYDMETTQKTIEDLHKNYGSECNFVEDKENYYMFDPGGSMWMDDVVFRFTFDGNVLEVRSQQWGIFIDSLNNANSQKNRDRGIFKLYGYIFILALDEWHYDSLVRVVNAKKAHYGLIAQQTYNHMQEFWDNRKRGV